MPPSSETPPGNGFAHTVPDLQQARRDILDLPARKALARIMDAPQPAALVHSFPEQDLYMLIWDIGVADALPLISLASDAQREFILDMDIWDRDRIDRLSAEQWIALFNLADPRRLARWLMDRQTAFTEYYLSQNIELRIREHDQDPSDWGDGFVTFDDTFYFRPLNIAGESPDEETRRKALLIEILNRMADRDYVRFGQILFEASVVIPAEYEEEAYRFRNVRLGEKGFVPFEEAVGIYQPLKAETFDDHVEKFVKPAPPDGALASAPLYSSAMLPSGGLFASALTHIASPNDLERLQIEFAVLCNTLAVADGEKISDRQTLSAVVQKACGYLGIGLERITGDDSDLGCIHSSDRIVKTPLSEIFRLGYGAALELKWRAQKWRNNSWFETQGLPLTFWGEHWTGVLGGLLIKKPLYFDNYRTGALYREFSAWDDVKETKTVLNRIIAFDALLSSMGISRAKSATLPPISYKNLLLTLWARHCLGLSRELVPIKSADFKRFYVILWNGSEKPRSISQTTKEVFLNWLVSRSGVPPEDISRKLGQTLDDLFQEIEGEYSGVSAEYLDPRHIHLFFTEK